MSLTLTLHGANRMLERDVPVEAFLGVKAVTPILNEKPLRFSYGGCTVVARMTEAGPRIITAWRKTTH
jgi:hypothetical protein